MAKKKQEEVVLTEKDNLTLIEKQIEKDFGRGVLVSAEDVLKDPPQVISISPCLDILLSGGVPEGSWVSICGKFKSGKSSIALSFAANCQKPENGSRMVWYLNVEGRIKQKNLYGTKGLDLSPDKFRIITSTPERILSTQDFLKQAEIIIKNYPKSLVIIDSVSALQDNKELEGGLGTETRGHNQKVISQFINNVATVVPVTKCIVWGITHIIANTSGFGASTIEKAANRWLYQADIRLKLPWSKPWVVGNREIGKEMLIEVQESALGGPGFKGTSYLRYGTGVDRVYEIMKLGEAVGLINRSGSWYNLTFLMENDMCPKFQGADCMYKALLDNTEWQNKLNDRLKQFVELLTDSMGAVKEE